MTGKTIVDYDSFVECWNPKHPVGPHLLEKDCDMPECRDLRPVYKD